MSKQHTVVYEYIKPTNIESEVPGTQPLREVPIDHEDANTQATFQPVLTTKKEEIAFTKGDLKLQRVSNQNGGLQAINPFYSEVCSEVIEGPQPLRYLEDSFETRDAKDGNEKAEEKKPKTRIPKLKQAVEKVKKDKNEKNNPENKNKKIKDEKDLEVPPTQTKRRSSIPRFKKKTLPVNKDKEETKHKHPKKEDDFTDNIQRDEEAQINDIKVINNFENPNINNKPSQSQSSFVVVKETNDSKQKAQENDKNTEEVFEDEFDKIYEQIVDNGSPSLIIDDQVISDKIKDPEMVETTFEKIIHDYDENKELSTEAKPKSKIPLKKQKSLHDVEIPKQLDRRLSLKNYNENPIKQSNSNIKNDDTKNQMHQQKDNRQELREKVSSGEKAFNVYESDKLCKEHYNDAKYQHKIKTIEDVKVAHPELNDSEQSIGKQTIANHKIITNKSVAEPQSEEINETKTKPIISTEQNVSKVHLNVPDLNNSKNTENLKSPKIETSVKYDKNINITPQETDNLTENRKVFLSTAHETMPVITDHHTGILGSIKLVKYIGNKNVNKKEALETIFPHNKLDNISYAEQSIEGDFLKNEGGLYSRIENQDAITDDNNPFILPQKEEDSYFNKKYENNNEIVEKSEKEDKDKFNKPKYGTNMNINPNEMPNKKSILSKIAIFSGKKEDKDNGKYPVAFNKIQGKNDAKLQKKINPKNFEVNEPKENTPINFFKDQTYKDQNNYASNVNSVEDRVILENQTVTFDREKQQISDRERDAKKKDHLETSDLPVKSKVNRIVNRLDSRNDQHLQPVRKDIEIPKQRSILSKIAMFERQFSKEPERILAKEILKPNIVNEILKKSHMKHDDNEQHGYTDSKFEHKEIELNTREVEKENLQTITENTIKYQEKRPLSLEEVRRVYEKKPPPRAYEYIKPINLPEKNIKIIDNPKPLEPHENRELKFEHQNSMIDKPNENTEKTFNEEFTKTKHNNEENGMKRAKSLAELDLGDAVKGKVHKMIIRINSMEHIDVDVEKKTVINAKERPRKRSVSEKIALFERKLAAVQMEETTAMTCPKDPDTTPATAEIPILDQDLTKISEMNGAKAKYGTFKEMQFMKLNNGIEMPVISLGTALIQPPLLKHVVMAAIDMGYRSFDTAYIYGTEKEIGEAIKAKIDDGTVTRKDLFITSKLWSTFHRPDLVEQACQTSLQNLGLDYLDLFLIHNPISLKEGDSPLPKVCNILQFSDVEFMDAWFAMENLVTKGLVKSIGLSNFNSEQVAKVVSKAQIKPVINQVECHPFLTQQRLDAFCSNLGVNLTCYGTLGSKGTPAEWKSEGSTACIDDPVIKAAAAELGLPVAQMLIRYQINAGRGVVVKSSSSSHLWENLNALNCKLTSEQVDSLHALNKNKRTYSLKGFGETHKNFPFTIPF